MYYTISAPGSCHGDSGGPVFQPALHKKKSIYVVLGNVVIDSKESVNRNLGYIFKIAQPLFTTHLSFYREF